LTENQKGDHPTKKKKKEKKKKRKIERLTRF
jgi:hypothetical protein